MERPRPHPRDDNGSATVRVTGRATQQANAAAPRWGTHGDALHLHRGGVRWKESCGANRLLAQPGKKMQTALIEAIDFAFGRHALAFDEDLLPNRQADRQRVEPDPGNTESR
jgi:hypothetical protein